MAVQLDRLKSEGMRNAMLKEIRTKSGATMRQVADTAGISESMYSLIESGKRRPSPEVAKRIAGYLGFDWTRFYDDTPINSAGEAV